MSDFSCLTMSVESADDSSLYDQVDSDIDPDQLKLLHSRVLKLECAVAQLKSQIGNYGWISHPNVAEDQNSIAFRLRQLEKWKDDMQHEIKYRIKTKNTEVPNTEWSQEYNNEWCTSVESRINEIQSKSGNRNNTPKIYTTSNMIFVGRGSLRNLTTPINIVCKEKQILLD